MIDTIFFLLVFFMITSLSMVALKSKTVTLPESETARLKPQNEVTLTISKAGTFYIDKQEISEADIPERLENMVELNPLTEVVINCDKGLPVTYFLRAFDLAKRSNAAHVMVATLPRGIKAAGP